MFSIDFKKKVIVRNDLFEVWWLYLSCHFGFININHMNAYIA